METCFKGIVDAATGKLQSITGQIDCNPHTVIQYFDWTVWIWIGGIALFVALIVWILVGYPRWRVWDKQKAGEADLQQAHKEQQIQVSKAQGRLDAATLNKQAAIVEAEAVSGQIEKIGSQLTKHDLYLKWQWIKMMEERPDSSVIYVPTEANLPILEAGRLKQEVKLTEE